MKNSESIKYKVLRFSLPVAIFVCVLLTGLMLLVGPYSAHIDFLPDTGFAWYYWKLPEPSLLSRLLPWICFVGHQLAIWYLIYRAQQLKPGYSTRLHRFNLQAIAVNLFFVLLHIAQTKFSYDGLAQDVHVFIPQFAVILLLVLVLMLEHQRRGLVFGKKLPLIDRLRDSIKRYHGYYFSWAIIFTFWFHPIEMTAGHLLGNFYTLLLLLQGSLFFTRFHTDKYWKVLLESFVLVHGAVVAWLSLQGGKPEMFAFGFMVVFMVTQIYGLGWRPRTIVLWQLGFVLAMLGYYAQHWQRLTEIFRVPGALYLSVILLTLLGLALLLCYRLVLNLIQKVAAKQQL